MPGQSSRLYGLLAHPCGAWRNFCPRSRYPAFGAPLCGANLTFVERRP